MATLAALPHASETSEELPPLRASDSDRMATVLVLQDAVARGLLTPTEGDERITAAFAATHRFALPPLTADLPAATAERRAPESSSRSWEVAVRVWLFLVHTLSRLPRRAKIGVAVLIAALIIATIGFGISAAFDGGPAGGPGSGGFRGRPGD